MYERSAIVLERYFENLLGFNNANNLRQNFERYCDLFEKFNVFQLANSEEFNALSEFQSAESAIEEIQNSQEKLYKKNAKLEYNRDLIFNDITQKPEEIEKCIVKIENDISKNQATLISLREKFVEAIRTYNEKKSSLSKCKKNRKKVEADYNVSFDSLKEMLDSIEEQYIEIAKSFVTEENQEDLISVMIDNGKQEKIQFNNSVITNAAKLGFDILEREVECYVEAYEMAKKLIDELLEGAVSVELHQKTIRNIKVKLNFLNAEKEYLVQFLDYERITVIYGKRTHRTLMIEACEKFEIDIEQINNLYKLLLKEIANKSTKKAYKELYNKSYLIDIEEKEAKFKKEKNKMNLPVGTIMNSNYWRIEGIKNIYTVFYKDVSEVFGKDLVEFDLPKEQDIEQEVGEFDVSKLDIALEEISQAEKIEVNSNVEKTEIIENVEIPQEVEVIETIEDTEAIDASEPVEVIEEVVIEIIEKTTKKKKSKAKKQKRYTRKKEENIIAIENEESKPEENIVPIENLDSEKEENIVAIEKLDKKKKKSKNKKQKNEIIKEIVETSLFEKANEEDKYDIFDERYRDIEKQIAEIDELEDLSIEELVENTPYESDDILFEEESIFGDIENQNYEELSLKKSTNSKGKAKKAGIFNKIIKLNSKEKKQANS